MSCRYYQAADVWAFGILLMEMATGHAPYANFSLTNIIIMTMHSPVPELDRSTYSDVMLHSECQCRYCAPAFLCMSSVHIYCNTCICNLHMFVVLHFSDCIATLHFPYVSLAYALKAYTGWKFLPSDSCFFVFSHMLHLHVSFVGCTYFCSFRCCAVSTCTRPL